MINACHTGWVLNAILRFQPLCGMFAIQRFNSETIVFPFRLLLVR